MQRGVFDGKNFAHLATLMPDGRPQVTPVWVDVEDGLIRVNSAKGRVKDKNMRRDARVCISTHDQENPYERVVVFGRVVEITEEGAGEHIDALARKYQGVDRYEWLAPGEVRVTYKIKPERVV
ncbi:MAG: PPOX class F420-dependent oxidoreductase [Actinomycetota bacterium]